MKLNKAYSCAELSVILEAKCEKNKSISSIQFLHLLTRHKTH